jgi:uncharacterized protein (UPF0297 family)|tara:strand:- start:62 stop:274 length:213 start_codon:yes stop_codon:yes gene_type:complete
MGAKSDALFALESVIKKNNLARTTVGREISGDPNFLTRLEDPKKTISTTTLDNIYRYILKKKGQLELDLE